MANPTLEYLKTRRPDMVHVHVFPTGIPANRTPLGRLSWGYSRNRTNIDPHVFATAIKDRSNPDAQFVLDTCFLTGEEIPTSLWECLKSFNILITPQVWSELSAWRTNPRVNSYIRDDLEDAFRHGHAKMKFLQPIDDSSPLNLGIRYYIALLGFRKQAFEIVRNHLALKHSATPTEDDVKQFVHRFVKDRGMQLAMKGEKWRNRFNQLADEETIVYAVASALTTGCETSILTRDADHIEQFFKLMYLLDTHYRAMLLAECLYRQPLNFHCQPLPEECSAPSFSPFNAELIKRTPIAQSNCLPLDPYPVTVYCYRFAGTGALWMLDDLKFGAEKEMARIIEMKGRTGGANTNLFGDRNFHMCVTPYDQETGAALLARDTYFKSERGLKWSYIDFHFALSRTERGSEIQYVQFTGQT